VSFYTVGLVTNGAALPLGPVELGLSADPSAFGTPIFSGAPASYSDWTHFVFEFDAPVTGSFLTISTSRTVPGMYAFVDDVSLEIPAPAVFPVAGLLVLGRRRSRTAPRR